MYNLLQIKYYKWVILFNLITISSPIFSQQYREVVGIIYEENSQTPIEFANISIKNAAAGTTTDAAGRFKIIIAKEKQTVIIVSHINYHKKE
jgi:hypothetical protein